MQYVIYARKSTESEDRQVQSLDDQISYLEKLAKERGLEVIKTFKESQSAKVPGRKEFKEMLQFIEEGHAKGILTWKIDRLTRNPKDGGDLQWLSQSGVIKEIITSDRIYLPEDNALILALESGMANQYIRDLSNNIKRGIISKLERGVWPNLAPIGYQNKDGKIKVDTKKAEYIKKAFTLYAKGTVSIKELSDRLYEEGFRSKSGKKYYKSKIHTMLSNTFYYGDMHMQGQYFAGTYKPIISKELFNKVQDVLNGKHHSKRQKHTFAYRGLMHCNRCNCMLTATKKKGYAYYYCTNGKGGCDEHKKYLREEKIEEAFARSLKCLTIDKELIDIIYKAKKEQQDKEMSYEENKLKTFHDQLAFASLKRSRLLDGYCSGIVTDETFQKKDSTLQREEVTIKTQIIHFDTKKEKELSTLEQQRNVFLTACTVQKKFLKAKSHKKQKALKTVLWNATVHDGKIANLSLKRPYDIIAEVDDLSDFTKLRRGRDSNPRAP